MKNNNDDYKNFKVSKENIKKFYEYVKESLEETHLPNQIKAASYKIRKDIEKNGDNSFQKEYIFWNLKFNIIINYTNGEYKPYYSKVNIYEILTQPEKPILIEVIIKDKSIDINYLMSIISHELRHVYDIFTVSRDVEFQSFIKSAKINDYFETKIGYFVELVYLSLEHEIIARHNMLYELYRYINITDKNELMKLFEKSFVYNALLRLNTFNSEEYIKKFNKEELTKLIISFSKDINDVGFNGDIVEYFKKWELLFKNKSKEFYGYVDNMLDDIINDIKNNKIYERFCGFISYNEDILSKVTQRKFKKILETKNNIII